MNFHNLNYMKKFILSILFFLITSTSILSQTGHYTNFNKLEYNLYRNNKLIGNHKFDFYRKDGNLEVKSLVEFKISKLGVDLYKYRAESSEIYENNVFSKFSAKTNQNKKKKYVNIVRNMKDKQLSVDGSSYKGPASSEYIVGTWWNHEIVKAKAQISAISGRIIKQDVTFIGKEVINIDGKNYNTLHFNFKSSNEDLPPEKILNTDIWYDEESLLWVKAAFDKTGYWEYRIKYYN